MKDGGRIRSIKNTLLPLPLSSHISGDGPSTARIQVSEDSESRIDKKID